MGFLKPKTEIKIVLPLEAAAAERIRPHIEVLLNNITADELVLLAQAVQKPILKSLALEQLKKFI